VADFIGESNILPGRMLRDRLVSFAGRDFVCVDEGFAPGEDVDAVVRPEDVLVSPPGDGQLRGTVESLLFKGVHYEMMVRSAGLRWMVHDVDPQPVGADIGLSVEPNDIHIMRREPPPPEDGEHG
jgi:spermidine/putrescine transport system ATP-binding protein